MIPLTPVDTPAVAGLRFRLYRGEEDLPAMLQVYSAAHAAARVYVNWVAVRRPWRRRGLARALLAGSLVGAREAGFTSANLGVDADSPTGATALYESIGFRPEKTFTTYRKLLV